MRILIAGAGTIGTNLAMALVKDGQDVVVVDTDPAKLARIESAADCQTVVGSAISPALMEEAGIRRTDLVVAVTESDPVNMTVCRLAEHYGVPRKVARIRNPEFADPECPVPASQFGIDHVISPEGIAVALIERLVACPGATEAVDFEQGRIVLRALVVTEESPLAGQPLSAIRQNCQGDFVAAAIRRGTRVIVPQGADQLRVGDTVYIVTEPELLEALGRLFDPNRRSARKVVVFGAGVMGTELATRLKRSVKHVVLVEPDATRARVAADHLDARGVEVLHGSALDDDLLARMGVDSVDFFFALTDDDENNLMSALLYRKYAGGTPVVLTNKSHYVDIFELMDLNIVINPRLLAVSAILRYLRGGLVVSVAKLHREEAEVLEFKVEQGSPVAKGALKSVRMPKGTVIAAVVRSQDLVIPRGETRIAAGDRVLVFTDGRSGAQVEALFKGPV